MTGKILGVSLSAALTVFTFAQVKASKGNTEKAPDVLLILGCRVKGDTPEKTLTMRINKAAEYLRENENVIAIACGGIVHNDQSKSEAQAIYEGLTAKGVDGDRIILEDKSTTTRENFINAMKLMEDISQKASVAILSSDFHLLRANIIAKKCGLKATTVASGSPKELKIKNYLRELVCLPEALIK